MIRRCCQFLPRTNPTPRPAITARTGGLYAASVLGALFLGGVCAGEATPTGAPSVTGTPGTTGTPASQPLAAGALPTGGQFSEENMQFDFALGLLRRGLGKEAAAEFTKYIAAYSQSPRLTLAYLHRAEAFFTAGQFQPAAQDYHRYLSANKAIADAGPLLRYGICLFELKDYAAAAGILDAVTRREPDEHTPSALYYAGICKQKLGQAREARGLLARVTAGSFRPLALYALAESHLDAKEYDAAADLFRQVTRDFPAHALAAKAQLARANALRLAGKLAESGADFQPLLASADPAVRMRAEYGLAWTEFGNHAPQKAQTLARKITQDAAAAEFHPGAWYLLGSIAFADKQYPEAIDCFGRVGPGDFAAKAALARGWALYETKDHAGALRQAQQAAQAYPAFPADEYAYLAGRCQMELNQFPAAAQLLLTAREAKGERQERAAYELGLAYEQAGSFGAAAEVFAYYVEHFPSGAQIMDGYAGLGRTLMAGRRYEAAIPVYATLLARTDLAPEAREAALSRQAVCYYYLKQYDNMARSYQQVLQTFPQRPAAGEALFWLAWYDSTQKKYREAAARYDDLLKRFPDHALAAKARYYLGSALLHGGQEEQAAEVFYALALAQPATPDKAGPALDSRELLWLGQYLSDHAQGEKAKAVFNLLLQREKPGLVRAVTLRGLAGVLRHNKDYPAALTEYNALLKLLGEIDGQPGILAALKNDALYGAAICLRETGKLELARANLDRIAAGADDPFMAKVYYERGLLEFAAQNYAKAAESLMRVGLLVDDEELAGQALLKAGEACEKAGDAQKAQICWDELAGKLDGSYGKVYPGNRYTAAGKEKSKQRATTVPNAR